MDPSGMVHALEQVGRLLKPSGRLVDIHPTGDPPRIEVRLGGQEHLAGLLRETDDFVEYFQADAALAQAVADGLFVVEQAGEFPFAIHADTLPELQAFLSEEWEDAILEEEVVRRAGALLAGAGSDHEVILRERVHIARLRPGSG